MEEEKELTQEWKIVPRGLYGGGGNHVLSCGQFSISYQPNQHLTPFAPILDCETPDGETALRDERDPEKCRFYILNGDWRKEYAELALKGFEACIEFYLSNKGEYGSGWSDSYELN